MTSTVGISTYGLTAPEFVALTQDAERCGFNAVWVGEHIALPGDYASQHPTSGSAGHVVRRSAPIITTETVLADPVALLAAAAAVTSTIRLGTAIYLLPLRHPILAARALATVSALAPGRVLFGVGAGWLREEFDLLDVPFDQRGARLEEAVDILRKAWHCGSFQHEGEQFTLGPLQVTPTPVDIDIVLGGNSDRALDRAVRIADGWFSSANPTLDEAVRLRDRIARFRKNHDRTTPLRCWFRVANLDAATRSRYADEGLTDLVIWSHEVWPSELAPDTRRDALRRSAETLGLAPRGAHIDA